jgi:hypothetical protein
MKLVNRHGLKITESRIRSQVSAFHYLLSLAWRRAFRTPFTKEKLVAQGCAFGY